MNGISLLHPGPPFVSHTLTSCILIISLKHKFAATLTLVIVNLACVRVYPWWLSSQICVPSSFSLPLTSYPKRFPQQCLV